MGGHLLFASDLVAGATVNILLKGMIYLHARDQLPVEDDDNNLDEEDEDCLDLPADLPGGETPWTELAPVVYSAVTCWLSVRQVMARVALQVERSVASPQDEYSRATAFGMPC